jgi:Ca-activated chloride channel family protein
MKKFRGRQLLIIILIFALCFVFSGSASAADNTNPDQKAVVFLLDASGSMKTNDPQRYAIDSIAQLIFTLPSNYEIGFAAYNTEVCASQELLDNDKRGQIMALAQAVEYAGFSNAGVGLEQAVRLLLEADPGTEKSIVLLSDGEFLMSDDALTERSRAAYQEASDLAAREGITIHVIGLGEDMENTDNSVFQAASLTGGGIYYTPGALGIQAAMESILTEWFQIKQTTAAMIDADGGDEVVPVELPFSYASVVRVLLTSDSPIKNVKTSFQGESANQVTGERYSLIEIVHPQSGRMEVSFVGTAGSQVRIALIPEYKAVPQISVSYEDQEPLDATAVRYDRTAVLEYSFYDGDNEHIQIWTEGYFDHSRILVAFEGISEEKALEQGRFIQKRNVEALTEKVVFDYSALPVNVLNASTVEVAFEEAPLLPAPEPESEPDPPYALYLIMMAAVIGIFVVIVYRRPKPQTRPKEIPDDGRPAPGKASYVGRLNIYIARTPSGYDIEPLSYDLFRLPSTKVISIAEALESCGVKETFEGADRIFLNSGQGKSVILTNQSDCCIMKSGEILMKKKSYQLFEGSKVDIMFEDETSELTFQYRVLKPSEML